MSRWAKGHDDAAVPATHRCILEGDASADPERDVAVSRAGIARSKLGRADSQHSGGQGQFLQSLFRTLLATGPVRILLMAHGARRIDETFGRLRQEGSGALWPFFTGGYPNVRATEEMLVRAAQVGVAGAEIGFPYSDSIADGPTIASSFAEALRRGVTVSDVFGLAASVRGRTEMPLLAMVSFSISTTRFF